MAQVMAGGRGAPSGINVPRVRPYLGRLWHDWRDGRRLAHARGLVPEILRRIPAGAGLVGASRWVIRWSQWSRTGVAVMGLGPASQPPPAILRLASADAGIQGLRAEAEALSQLHADSRLGDWRRKLPHTVAEGWLADTYYTVQEALPGVEAQSQVMATDPDFRAYLTSLAAWAIRPMHERTSELAIAGAPSLAEWIDYPISFIRQAASSDLPVEREEALPRLRAELYTALAGRALRTAWIHGDFWLGNVLVTPAGDEVTALVDWSMAAPHELALHDVFHLLLYGRQMAQSRELGDVVRAVLVDEDGAEWQPFERTLLEAEEQNLQMGEIGQRALVLLYWLRRLRSIFEQQRGHAQNRVWAAWNIDQVLQVL